MGCSPELSWACCWLLAVALNLASFELGMLSPHCSLNSLLLFEDSANLVFDMIVAIVVVLMVIMIVVTMDVMMVVMIALCNGNADGQGGGNCGGHDCGYKAVVMMVVIW